MRFRFCGEADCPDWVLAEINSLSKLSSVKLKLLSQVVAQGMLNPPINMEQTEKLFADSKLDADIDLKACIACIKFVLTSATRFGCDSSALQRELQQLGLPREHSTSIKRVFDDQVGNLTEMFRGQALKINCLRHASARVDENLECAVLDLNIDGKVETLTLTPKTVDVLLENLKTVRKTMLELKNAV